MKDKWILVSSYNQRVNQNLLVTAFRLRLSMEYFPATSRGKYTEINARATVLF